MKRYEIHDNGGRPFIVDVGANKLSIHEHKYDPVANSYDEPKHFKDYTFRRVWIGDDTMGFGKKMGWRSAWKGNSILAELTSGKMLFIGMEIYEFSMLPGDEPVLYSSYVGNNDVPYPWLVGKTHTYLMIENRVIPNEYLDIDGDAYVQFYGFNGNKTAADHAMKLKKKVVHKRMI